MPLTFFLNRNYAMALPCHTLLVSSWCNLVTSHTLSYSWAKNSPAEHSNQYPQHEIAARAAIPKGHRWFVKPKEAEHDAQNVDTPEQKTQWHIISPLLPPAPSPLVGSLI